VIRVSPRNVAVRFTEIEMFFRLVWRTWFRSWQLSGTGEITTGIVNQER